MPTDPMTLPESECDRLAAEKVMGWKTNHCTRIATDIYDAPEFVPFNCGRADHDYLILRKVRESWSAEDVECFDGHLFSIALKRVNQATDRMIKISLRGKAWLNYEPGMWRDAALLVLAEKREI